MKSIFFKIEFILSVVFDVVIVVKMQDIQYEQVICTYQWGIIYGNGHRKSHSTLSSSGIEETTTDVSLRKQLIRIEIPVLMLRKKRGQEKMCNFAMFPMISWIISLEQILL